MHIPGYQIIEELGRGGMARVYLAMQESLERYVALKIISQTLAADRTFTERFLKEGRIVAHLTHPNIVTVYDFGSYQDTYYMAMEYLPGGTLEEQIQKGLALERVLEIVKTVASALGYAHKQGFIHRDVKPLNILFRKDGTPVLSDFGIARVVHSHTELTGAGQVVGSPGYMSPERIRGQPIDSRSDLYSVGVVFYKMLTGSMPYQADDPFTVALMHTTAPIPVLPKQFARFQPLLEKLLAKEPDQRFQTAEEFIAALSKSEDELADEPDRTLVDSDVVRQKRGKEAQLPEKKAKVSARTKLGLGLGAISALGAAGIYLALNLPTPAPQPEPASYPTKPSPDTAKTDRKPEEPMDGMKAVGAYYQKQAEKYRQEGNLEESLNQIKKGLQVLPDDPDLLALRQAVQTELAEQQRRQAEAEQRQRGIERLLAQAEQQRRQDRLTGPADANAVASYRQVLELDPDNAQARQGLNEIAEYYRQRAERLQEQGALEESLTAIEQGLAVRPSDAELLALRQAVQRQIREKQELAEKQKQKPPKEDTAREVEQLLAQADEQLRRLRLTLPAGDNAYETYQRILELDPDNEKARQGIIDIADRYQRLAEQYRQRGDLQRSLEFADRGLQIVPQHAGLLALRQTVIQAQQADAQRRKAEEEARRVEVERRRAEEERGRTVRQAQEERREREVRDLLAQAERQLQGSQLTAAYDSFQRVLRLDPQNAVARRGLTEIGDRYLQLAQQSKNRGALQESLTNISEGLRVMPQHPGLLALRNELQAMLLGTPEPETQKPQQEEPEKTKMMPFATF